MQKLLLEHPIQKLKILSGDAQAAHKPTSNTTPCGACINTPLTKVEQVELKNNIRIAGRRGGTYIYIKDNDFSCTKRVLAHMQEQNVTLQENQIVMPINQMKPNRSI